ncbi:hypothetical protein B0T24DRAFT_648108 [Lasiosphaeria ovina]|uniref:Protein SQS1 n=1 Tax=Lasiosphaeria ovina TaxID=92902 RepID=A0AAE0KGA8_9PEZI|nr:hypothetical protein B0T24DRAFT_648108 [Lasiosphaeria ovina]
MQDEARNTRSHEFTCGQDAGLRKKPVVFISAGFIEPLKDAELPSADDGAAEGRQEICENDGETLEQNTVVEASPHVNTTVAILTTVKHEAVASQNSIGDSNVLATPPGPMNPSSNVFFFDLEGDKEMRNTRSRPDIVSPHSPDASDSGDEVILFRGRSANTQGAVHPGNRLGEPEKTPNLLLNCDDICTKKRDVTIGNSRANSKIHQVAQLSSSQNRPRFLQQVAQDASEDGEDEEDIILADYIANIAEQSDSELLATRLRPFNTQRDLGGDHGAFNCGFGDQEELPATNTSSDDEVGAGSCTPNNNMGDDDERNAAGSENEGSVESDIDDEAFARLFAKQEKLGLLGKHRTSPANLVAEAFVEMNLADWTQPGQRPSRSRRSKQPPVFNVSDSELETALKTAWQNDRERKKNRKLERENLRANGLLRKNSNPDDLRIKYHSGMKLDDIKTELVSFLLSPAETIQFPPMDKQARKLLHELANKFKIKSQSIGKSDQRRPVLYRTKHTVKYAETQEEEAASHVNGAAVWIKRKYFHRLDVKGKAFLNSPTPGGRSGNKAIMLREGEIAGASAPELGQDNKGHAMMEKMGWSKGMALGAIENKGILEPVAQVVKRSKAGLG